MRLNESDVIMSSEEPIPRPSSPGVNQLMVACQQDNEIEVKKILSKKPELVNQKDRTGKCALHYCAENKTTACAVVLLERDLELLKYQDEEGYSSLHLAVISGNKKVVKFLLAQGSDSNCKDSEDHSCVHWATVCGEVDCLEMLLNGGADPSTPDIHGAFPIHYAAQMCGPNSEMGNDVRVGLFVLRKLLESGVDVNCRDQDGRQPLLWAASAGSGDAILALVNAGASVCSVDKDGLTALHCAASRGHVECLDTLITLCGAEVDFMDNNGCTALFYSVTLGHADCTTLLLKYGANPNRQDRKGRTPAHCGAAKGQLETIKILSQYGANIWMRNIRGDLPLHEAVQSGRRDLVRWLLEQLPVAVNAGNSNGRTALHIAAVNNNVEMCKILMDLAANVNPLMRNNKSQLMSPLDAALQRGNQGCAKYLQLHGALPATKLLEKHGVNRAFLASIETRNRMPVPEMKIRSPYENELARHDNASPYTHPNTRIESSAQTDQHRYSQRDREIQANQSDFPEQITGTRSPHQKVVSVQVHRGLDNGEITEARIERTTYRDPNYQPTRFEANENRRNAESSDIAESLRDRGISTDLDIALDEERDSAPLPLKHTSQQTSTIDIKGEIEKLENQNLKAKKTGQKVEFESVKGDGNESEGDMPNDSLTEFEGSYTSHRGRRAKSENTLRRRVNREIRQVGRDYKQRSNSEPRSKVNYIRVRNGEPEPYYLKDDRVLTIEINENQMPPIIPNVARQKSHNQAQMAKLKNGTFGTTENSIISPNSSVRSTESNATTQKDSGFSDYIEMIRSVRQTRGDASSEGSTETLAAPNADKFWTSDSAADMLDFSRRRRTKRRPFKSEDPLELNRKFNEKNSDIVSEYKNAVPRVAERLQKDKVGTVNLNNVKSKIDTGFYGRRATTIPSRERARVVKVIRPASESQRYANPDTIAQEVQQSLRKFELERKLFQELQDLKRQQIRSGRANEAFMVKRLVDKFRKDILCPGVKDFEPPFTYRNFERYLYDVLRTLSTSNHGKVPKLKPVEEVGLKSTFIRDSEGMSPSQCVIRTYKCTHASEAYAGYPASVESVFHNKNYTKLPAIPNNKVAEHSKSTSQQDTLLTPATESSDALTPTTTAPTRLPKTDLHEKGTIASLQKMSGIKTDKKREIIPRKRPPQPFKIASKTNSESRSDESQKSKKLGRPAGNNGWLNTTKVSPKFSKPSKLKKSNKNATEEEGGQDTDERKESKVKITRDRRDSLDEESKKLIHKEAKLVLEEVVSKVVQDVGSGRPVSAKGKPNTETESPKEKTNFELKHPVLSSITTMFTSPLKFIKGYDNKTRIGAEINKEEVLTIETNEKKSEIKLGSQPVEPEKDEKNREEKSGTSPPNSKSSSKNNSPSKDGVNKQNNDSRSSSRKNSPEKSPNHPQIMENGKQDLKMTRASSSVPTVVLEAVRENLNEDAKPDDLVTVEVSSEELAKVTQTLTVQELIEATQSKTLAEKEWEYPEKQIPRVKSAEEPFTFEIKHGHEKNIYKLPSEKLKGSKKYKVTFVIGRQNPNENPTVKT